MNIAEIKKVIKENPRVILYFGSDWDSFVAAAKATGGFTLGRTNNCTELCLLYANGKYDGFNREDSIEFFQDGFPCEESILQSLDCRRTRKGRRMAAGGLVA